MLEPRSYPKMIGQALVLEPEPFVQMVEDDNPWTEGLFLTTCIGAAAALASVIGGLLMRASLPPYNTLLNATVSGWERVAPYAGTAAEPVSLALRENLGLWLTLLGYGSWLRLTLLVLLPLALIVQWALMGAVGHWLARLLGGRGTLNQTLGAAGLMMAPYTLLLITVIPFVGVPLGLLAVWGLLLTYRALAIAHDLAWPRAAAAAVGTFVVVALVFALLGSLSLLLV